MKKHSNPESSSGTSYFGHNFMATTASLRALFGEPHYADGDYTIDEWVLDMHGITVTVYHRGDTHYPLEEPLRWHIGAHHRADSLAALLHLRELINPTHEPCPKNL